MGVFLKNAEDLSQVGVNRGLFSGSCTVSFVGTVRWGTFVAYIVLKGMGQFKVALRFRLYFRKCGVELLG